MKQLIDFVKKAFISALPYLLLLLFVMAIYGFGDILKLGLYSDDWTSPWGYMFNMSNTKQFGPILIPENLQWTYRAPVMIFFMMRTHLVNITGSHTMALHFNSVALIVISSFLIYRLVYKIVRNRFEAVLISIFILTYPGKSTLFFWPSTVYSQVSVLFTFILLNIILSSSRLGSKKRIFYVFLSTLISVWSYELGLIVLPVLILFLIRKGVKAATLLLFTLASVCGAFMAIYFKLFIFSTILGQQQVKETSLSTGYFLNVIDIILNILSSALNAFSTYFGDQFSNYIYTNFNLIAFISLLVFVFPLLLLLYIVDKQKDITIEALQKKSYIDLIALGTFFIMFNLAIFSILGKGAINEVALLGKANRFYPYVSFGSAYILVGLISTLVTNKRVLYLVLTLLITLNLTFLQAERDSYIYSWSLQNKIVQYIEQNMSSLNKFSSLYSDVGEKYSKTLLNVPIIEDTWTIDMLLKTTLNDNKVKTYLNERINFSQTCSNYLTFRMDRNFLLTGCNEK